jgi:hypothetical protein
MFGKPPSGGGAASRASHRRWQAVGVYPLPKTAGVGNLAGWLLRWDQITHTEHLWGKSSDAASISYVTLAVISLKGGRLSERLKSCEDLLDAYARRGLLLRDDDRHPAGLPRGARRATRPLWRPLRSRFLMPRVVERKKHPLSMRLPETGIAIIDREYDAPPVSRPTGLRLHRQSPPRGG